MPWYACCGCGQKASTTSVPMQRRGGGGEGADQDGHKMVPEAQAQAPTVKNQDSSGNELRVGSKPAPSSSSSPQIEAPTVTSTPEQTSRLLPSQDDHHNARSSQQEQQADIPLHSNNNTIPMKRSLGDESQVGVSSSPLLPPLPAPSSSSSQHNQHVVDDEAKQTENMIGVGDGRFPSYNNNNNLEVIDESSSSSSTITSSSTSTTTIPCESPHPPVLIQSIHQQKPIGITIPFVSIEPPPTPSPLQNQSTSKSSTTMRDDLLNPEISSSAYDPRKTSSSQPPTLSTSGDIKSVADDNANDKDDDDAIEPIKEDRLVSDYTGLPHPSGVELVETRGSMDDVLVNVPSGVAPSTVEAAALSKVLQQPSESPNPRHIEAQQLSTAPPSSASSLLSASSSKSDAKPEVMSVAFDYNSFPKTGGITLAELARLNPQDDIPSADFQTAQKAKKEPPVTEFDAASDKTKPSADQTVPGVRGGLPSSIDYSSVQHSGGITPDQLFNSQLVPPSSHRLRSENELADNTHYDEYGNLIKDVGGIPVLVPNSSHTTHPLETSSFDVSTLVESAENLASISASNSANSVVTSFPSGGSHVDEQKDFEESGLPSSSTLLSNHPSDNSSLVPFIDGPSRVVDTITPSSPRKLETADKAFSRANSESDVIPVEILTREPPPTAGVLSRNNITLESAFLVQTKRPQLPSLDLKASYRSFLSSPLMEPSSSGVSDRANKIKPAPTMLPLRSVSGSAADHSLGSSIAGMGAVGAASAGAFTFLSRTNGASGGLKVATVTPPIVQHMDDGSNVAISKAQVTIIRPLSQQEQSAAASTHATGMDDDWKTAIFDDNNSMIRRGQQQGDSHIINFAGEKLSIPRFESSSESPAPQPLDSNSASVPSSSSSLSESFSVNEPTVADIEKRASAGGNPDTTASSPEMSVSLASPQSSGRSVDKNEPSTSAQQPPNKTSSFGKEAVTGDSPPSLALTRTKSILDVIQLLSHRLYLAGDFFISLHSEDGTLGHSYDRESNSISRESVPIRDISVAWCLSAVGAALGRTDLSKYINALLTNYSSYVQIIESTPSDSHALQEFIASSVNGEDIRARLNPSMLHEASDIAHSALLILAQIEASRCDGDALPVESDRWNVRSAVRALSMGIVSQQRASGSYKVFFSPQPDTDTELYAGEAMVALMHAHSFLGEEQEGNSSMFAHSVAYAFPYYRSYFEQGRADTDTLVFSASWLTHALCLLSSQTSDAALKSEIRTFVYKLNDDVVSPRPESALFLAESQPAAVPTVFIACIAEGLIHAYQMAVNDSDGDSRHTRALRYREALVKCTKFLLDQQDLEMGGFFTLARKGEMRVDVAAHACHALVKIYHTLATDSDLAHEISHAVLSLNNPYRTSETTDVPPSNPQLELSSLKSTPAA